MNKQSLLCFAPKLRFVFVQNFVMPKQRRTRKRVQETYYIVNKEDQPIDINDVKIEFPFKSKSKYRSVAPQLKNKGHNLEYDLNPAKQQNKFQRPYFSPSFLSYECDLAFFDKLNYMFVINVNTKFLYVIYLANKNENEMIDAFMNLFHAKSANVQTPHGLRINNLRFDGESALNSKILKQFFEKHNIKCYSNSSPYINKNRVVDRVIRTIRTAIDTYMFNNGIEHLSVANHRKLMRQIVAIYNNTKHNSTGLKPIEMTFQQELDYIKNKERKLKLQMAKQDQNGLLNYEPDDELLIYLPSGKTDKFSKKHIYYSTPAIFIKYNHGNVIAQLEDESIVEVPVYYTRRA